MTRLRAFLIDVAKRLGEGEWWQPQIERPPVTRDEEGLVALDQTWKRRREQIPGVAPHELADGRQRGLQGKVHEAIAAQDQVHGRQLVFADIQHDESNRRTAIPPRVRCDEIWDDIRPDVLRSVELHVPHPVKVTTRNIE